MRLTVGCNLFWSLFGGSSSLILFSIFLVLKVDGVIDWNWYVVFIPVWLSFLFYTWFISWIFIFALDRDRKGLLGAAVWIEAAGLAVLLWTILISLKLELESFKDVSWASVFIPAWIGMGLFSMIHPGWPDWKHEMNWDSGRTSEHDNWKRFFEVLPLNVVGAIAVFSILLVADLQTSHSVCSSWSVCFIPFWYLSGVILCLLCTNLIDLSREGDAWPDFFAPSLLALPFFAFVILMSLFLDGIIGYLAYAFIPLFLLELVWFCSSCIIPCVLS